MIQVGNSTLHSESHRLINSNWNKEEFHVRWVPCHHGMARPQVADGGKSSRYGQPTRGGPLAWGLGVGPTTPNRKNFLLLRNVSKCLGPGLILWYDLSIGKRT
jgi:hypothetical protein